MTNEQQQIEIVDNSEASRFEALIGGERAGLADYRDRDGVRSFTHTEVDPSFGGRGVGSKLVDEALRATIADGMGIKPICSFVVARAAADEFSSHVVER